jgi:hypothetical protein
MLSKRLTRIHRKSRDRGRVMSFVVHLLLLLVAFLPFLSFQTPKPPTKEALVIQFDYPYNEFVAPQKFIKQEIIEPENMDMADKMSGSEAGGNPLQDEPMQSRPQQAAPSSLSNPQMTAVSRTQTASALRSNLGEINLPTPRINQPSAWQSVNDFNSFESDGVEEMKIIDWSDGAFGDVPGSGPGDGDDVSHLFSDGFGSGTGGSGGTGTGTGNTTGAGSGPGGGTGSGGAGDKTGIGQGGSGLQWGVGLDGLLNRQLVQRANVGSLAVKQGKIGIIICVNRDGKVISTKYDLAGSTLKDPEFVKKAETVAMNYIFAQDVMAPEKQCGKLTFVFKIK